jgi:hypothetical protein
MASVETKPAEPAGLGGWLILLGIGQVLSPIQFAVRVVGIYGSLPEGLIAQQPVAFAGDVVIRLSVLVLFIVSAWLFFNKRRSFPNFFIVSMTAAFLMPFVLGAWVTAASGVNTLVNLATLDFIGPYLLALVVTALWIAYLRTSVRVRNTFVH